MIYSHLINDLTDATFLVFDTMAEMIQPEGSNELFEVNKWYRASELKDVLGIAVPASCLTSLVSKGLLEDDRDKKGKLYCITDEIYNEIVNTYYTTKDKYTRLSFV